MPGNARYRLSLEEQEILRQYRETGAVPTTDEDLLRSDRTALNLADKYRALQRKYSAAVGEIEKLSAKTNVINKFETSNISQNLLKFNKNKSNKSESVAVTFFSDIHYGAVVDPTVVNNINEYNNNIAKKRITKYFENLVKLINLSKYGTEINNLTFCLGGDLISGDIHDELIESNESTAVQSTIEMVNIIRNGIDYIISNTDLESIYIPCVFGNHSRNTKKTQASTGYAHSYEYILYSYLQNIYENEPRVTFDIAKGIHIYQDILGYKLRFHHGCSIKYSGGIGGVTIPVNKAIANWNRNIKVDYDVFGHYHQLTFAPNFVLNGSVVGLDAYALSIKAAAEAPQQAFFLIEKDHGKTLMCPVHCGD